MVPAYTQPLVEMGVSLTELAIKGTTTAVTNKINHQIPLPRTKAGEAK